MLAVFIVMVVWWIIFLLSQSTLIALVSALFTGLIIIFLWIEFPKQGTSYHGLKKTIIFLRLFFAGLITIYFPFWVLIPILAGMSATKQRSGPFGFFTILITGLSVLTPLSIINGLIWAIVNLKKNISHLQIKKMVISAVVVILIFSLILIMAMFARPV